MMKYAAIAGLAVGALFATLYAFQSAKVARMETALKNATAYIQTTKKVRDEISDLPSDPDGILAELCRIAPGGAGCGAP